MHPRHDRRRQRERLLLEMTGLPTAAGREDRVIAFIERWVADRPRLALSRDPAGNLWIVAARVADRRPQRHDEPGVVVFEAHLDHPAFVVTECVSVRRAWAEFRGGVKPPYFDGARVRLCRDGRPDVRGRVAQTVEPDETAGRVFRRARLEFEEDAEAQPGEIATWDLPAPVIERGRLRAPACDDLAAVAAALSALEELLPDDGQDTLPTGQSDEVRVARSAADTDVRVLLTRAEEVGFVGAIAACRSGSIPAPARIIALENSRAFADSPIGAGPIVRVGDRLSVFSPGLTAAVAKVAQGLAKRGDDPAGAGPHNAGRAASGFRWQRKLMPGGACEASAFCAFGYEATCVCLPLGNYHNMGRLDEVERALASGQDAREAPIVPEEIGVEDFHGLVDLLVACGRGIGAAEPLAARLERMYAERSHVLDG
ncbi:MAG: hypothetical protein D6693_00065 [Planctomycetota bacterium]|nr:MAG: hypothetical protein D6693_00065 [Planctomycetota bacterium]